ncbi:LysR family transcriptional regulator [Pseudoduganella albidiflava]|uniref:LysR family transcriptional regulator n=1 Tax=Pseudoduganella albidiflava TaxID=321983 RepID=A0A411WVN1_9BURK|nr:LysR family transcriptional regulator [Pseudoduganella albidiflava]QBI00810.1 LysR family transcriptional regulator [Pseudoduganella albidiflava]GGY30586.1 LysR family transcriptional regulator [Pseudoduganella albidiflava]
MISTINERNFRGVDLNLLVTFLVLMRERSVSGAARKLFIGQPAASSALARLRELFGDELLVRGAHGMEPTARALALEAALAPALGEVQAALFESLAFDPATAEHTFTLGMPDWVELWLMPRLFERVRLEAPGVRIAVKVCDPFTGTAMLEAGEIDLGVGAFREGPRWQKYTPLRTMGFRCLFNPALVKTRRRGRLALADYTAHPHVLVSYRAAFESAADEQLAAQGLRRDVRYVTPRFALVPGILRHSPAIGTAPEVLAPLWPDLVSCAVPVALPAFDVSAIGHARRERDPALAWLLGVIAEVARE